MTFRTVDITVLFDDVSQDTNLQAAHGAAYLIEGLSRTILFDTGGDGYILLENMAKLGKNPKDVDLVVISHAHWDHSGGLFAFLREASDDVEVFVPKAVSKDFRTHAELLGAHIRVVDDPIEIADVVHSTGEMGGYGMAKDKKEQGIVIEAEEGPVVITGCAHPSIFHMLERVDEIFEDKIYLVLGGFHLRDAADNVVAGVIREIQGLGVKKVGPTHCTGERQIEAFKDAWKSDFIDFRCGATVQVHAKERESIPA
ncbi:MAG: MBL fold metallo-hydrolase [Rhodospirillales bacterium]|nr:MBL fold metallo-hydrolase [Rhodospirillales bacterium]